MGTRTVDEIIADVRYNFDNRVDIAEERILRYINQTQDKITQPRVYKHRELELIAAIALVENVSAYSIDQATFAAGPAVLVIPAGSLRLYATYDVTYYAEAAVSFAATTRRKKLPRISHRRLMRQSFVTPGEPTRHSIFGQMLFLDRNPTAAVAGDTIGIQGYWQPADLAAGGGTTILAPTWDTALELGATWLTFRNAGHVEKAAIWKQDFTRWVNDITQPRDVEGEDEGRSIEVLVADPMMRSI